MVRLACLILLLGCNSAGVIMPQSLIFGTWILEKKIYTNCFDPKVNHEIILECTQETCQKLTLTEDGKYLYSEIVNQNETITTSSYSIDSIKITVCQLACVGPRIFTVTRDGLSIYYPDSGCTLVEEYTRAE